MKKTWANAEIETVELRETAFGVTDPESADSEKSLVTIDGKKGWQLLFGEASV